MSSAIIKELVEVYCVDNLLVEMKTQLNVLAEEYAHKDSPKSAKDYGESAQKINRLITIEKLGIKINAKWVKCPEPQNFMGSDDRILVVGKLTLARIYKVSNSNTWGVCGINIGNLKFIPHYFDSLKEAQDAVELKLSVV